MLGSGFSLRETLSVRVRATLRRDNSVAFFAFQQRVIYR